jgi:glucosamine kinase
MVVVVDSGSTKADWQIVRDSGVEELHTRGANPVFLEEDEIYNLLSPSFEGNDAVELAREVFFYGAGCWDEGRTDRVRKALMRIFPNAEVDVEHDLLGAARATCGNDPGISCIIGTGSNTCLYDGAHVTDNVTNLGYLIGDEGSGSWLGKELIRTYFYREMPSDLRAAFDIAYPGGESAILDAVYESEDTPNVYLAGFTRFFSAHKGHFFIQQLLYNAFSVFLDRHVRKYRGYNALPIHFIGSVAYYFEDILKIILAERNLIAGVFIQKPIDRLTGYHLGQSVRVQ